MREKGNITIDNPCFITFYQRWLIIYCKGNTEGTTTKLNIFKNKYKKTCL